MEKLFICLLFIFTIPASYACWAPECYGAVGFNPKTGETGSSVDYPSASKAWKAVLSTCPSCSDGYSLTFNNTCGTIVYSKSHDFGLTYYGFNLNSATSAALSACRARINKIGLSKTSGDKRKSKRRSGEEGSCQIVVSACTYRVY